MQVFNTSEKLERDPRLAQAQRAMDVVTKVASTLANRKIRATLSANDYAPAWSTATDITFAEKFLPNLREAEGVLQLNGVTYHEVAHILYTPRNSSKLMRWVMDNHLGNAFNILEDCRIESLMVGKYRYGVIHWFTAMAIKYLLTSDLSTAFILTYGRKYLPYEVRVACREEFIAQQYVNDLARIIDTFRVMAFDSPEEVQQAQDLIVEFDTILKQIQSNTGCGPIQPSNHPDSPVGSSFDPDPDSRIENSKKVRKIIETMDKGFEDEPKGCKGDFSPTGGYVAQESSSDKNEEDSKGAPDSSKEDSRDTSDDSSSSGAGGQKNDTEFKDILTKALDKVMEELKHDIDNTVRAVNGEPELRGSGERSPAQAHYEEVPVDSSIAWAATMFANELKRLKSANDPAFEYETKSGRLNIQRVVRQPKTKKPFDKWTVGRDDAVNIETVIVLDNSGSMGDRVTDTHNRADLAYQAMYGLKSALDRLPDTSTTVIVFNSDSSVLYRANEKALGTVRNASFTGGTNPVVALRYAQQILSESNKTTKILFTITDGDWNSGEVTTDSEKVIETLRIGGVLTATVLIGGQAAVNAHKAELSGQVHNPSELVLLGRKLVNLAIARNLAN